MSTAPLASRRQRQSKRFVLVASLVALSLAASASPTAASVTIGQLGTPSTCIPGYDWVQPTVTSGNGYVVPPLPPATVLVITSWSNSANANAGQILSLKVFRKVEDPATYQVVGHDGPRSIAPSTVNTFQTNIPVQPGDVLGLHAGAGTPACIFEMLGDAGLYYQGDLSDGAKAAFVPDSDDRVNVTAVVSPSNTFSRGAITRNKKKGTATLTVNVPNPGELTGSGNGAKVASAGRAVISKSVGAGPAQVLIRAKGKKRRKLNATGKVKVNVAFTYTPTGGDPSTQSAKLKLIKR
jgi:hypothetical protein